MKKILNILLVYFAPCLLIVMLFYSREHVQNQSFKLSEVNIKADQNQFVSRDLVESLLSDHIVDADGKYDDNFLRNQITSIDVSNSELSMFARTGELIEFGRVKDMNHKFTKLKLYYDNVSSDFSILNLKYNNQIICKNS